MKELGGCQKQWERVRVCGTNLVKQSLVGWYLAEPCSRLRKEMKVSSEAFGQRANVTGKTLHHADYINEVVLCSSAPCETRLERAESE